MKVLAATVIIIIIPLQMAVSQGSLWIGGSRPRPTLAMRQHPPHPPVQAGRGGHRGESWPTPPTLCLWVGEGSAWGGRLAVSCV